MQPMGQKRADLRDQTVPGLRSHAPAESKTAKPERRSNPCQSQREEPRQRHQVGDNTRALRGSLLRAPRKISELTRPKGIATGNWHVFVRVWRNMPRPAEAAEWWGKREKPRKITPDKIPKMMPHPGSHVLRDHRDNHDRCGMVQTKGLRKDRMSAPE